MDKEKVFVVNKWPQPQNIKQLKGFLGLTDYYHRFIRNYSTIVDALTKLLKKESFIWNAAADASFNNLK